MKKLFAIFAILGLMSVGLQSVLLAQDAEAETATEQVEAAPTQVEEVAPTTQEVTEEATGFHKALKIKFIEGGAFFMSLVAIPLILGLHFV